MGRYSFIKETLERLNTQHISYAVLRNYDFLLEEREPKTQSEQGLDIVVKASDFPKFKQLLLGRKFSIAKQSFSRKHINFIALEKDTLISFDVQVGGIHWNDMMYLNDETIFTHHTKKSFFYTLSDEDMYIMLLAHSILGKRKFKPEYKELLEELHSQIDMEYVQRKLTEIFGKRYATKIIKQVNLGEFTKIVSKKYALIRAFLIRSPKRIPTLSLLTLRWLKWKKFLSPYPLISVVGPDGSGKSTLTKNIISFLENHNRNTHFVYNGRGRDHILPMTKLGYRYKMKEKKHDAKQGKKDATQLKHKSAKKQKTSLARKALYTLASPLFTTDLLIRYVLRILPKRRAKYYVVTDRYCSDIILMKHVPFWLKRLFLAFFPRPTISIYLYNDPETLHARRPEESVEELRRQMDIFRKFEYTFSVKTEDEKQDTETILQNVLRLLYKKGF